MTKIPTWGKQGFKSNYEYCKYLAKQKGFKSQHEYKNYLAQQKGFKSLKEYLDSLAKQKGFKSQYKYDDYLAQQKGFKSHYEYQKQQKLCQDLRKKALETSDPESLFSDTEFLKRFTKCEINKSEKSKGLKNLFDDNKK